MAIWVQQQLDAGMSLPQVADVPQDLRRPGPLRPRRRRQLQRARRLHRPLPDRPRRAATRPPATRTRAPTPSGATAGTPALSPFGSAPAAWRPRRATIGSNGGVVRAAWLPNNPTGVWVGDYTIQPENGGLGVFAHEYTHDLGLPDLYDTSGNTGGAENSTAFWTLMSSGANIGDGGPDGIGDDPTDLSAWELLTARLARPAGLARARSTRSPRPAAKSTHKLGPNVPATKSPQAVFTLLPDKEVPLRARAPRQRVTTFFCTGSGEQPQQHDDAPRRGGTALTPRSATTSRRTGTTRTSRPDRRLPPRGSRSRPTCRTPRVTRAGSDTSGTGMTGTSAGWTDLTATLPAGHATRSASATRPTAPPWVRVPGRRGRRQRYRPIDDRLGFNGFRRRPAARRRRSSTPTSWRTGSTTATTSR